MTAHPAPDPPRLVTPALLATFVASFGAMTGFFLLLSVVPRYVAEGGGGGAGAGLITGVLLLSTVAAELAVPRLTARFGARRVFAAGLLLLGAPALGLPSSSAPAAVATLSGVRGLGFGIVVVLGGMLVASSVPAHRRGEGLGLLGVVVGVPGVLALPLGVYLVEQVGYPVVLSVGGVAALAGLVAVPGLPDRRVHPTAGEPAAGAGGEPVPARRPFGIVAGLRMPGLVRPSVAFAATAVASGVVATFLPLAVADQDLAAAGLLVQAAAATVARWWAGRYGDRRGPTRLVVPGLLATAGGVAALAPAADPVVTLAGLAVFGAGFGVSQNASLSLMFQRAGRAGYATVSALWNIAFDAGMGLGAAAFGVVAGLSGYPFGFALTAVLVLTALVPVWRDRTRPVGSAGR